jgi:hypothetical protein
VLISTTKLIRSLISEAIGELEPIKKLPLLMLVVATSFIPHKEGTSPA